MSDTTQRKQKPQAVFKMKLRQEGYREVLVWVRSEAKEQIDSLVATGRFKNQSKVFEAAIEQFINGATKG